MAKIKIGYAPTRRSIFSAPDAVKYRGLTADRLKELGIDFVDITDVNDEGLLYDEEGRIKIAEKFKKEKIDGLFLPHCNFGTEFECARLAKELNVPVLLWDLLMRDQTRMVSVFVIHSADFLQQVKSSEDSAFHLHT